MENGCRMLLVRNGVRLVDYEQIGTSAVIQVVSKTKRLKAFVNSGDKEPSFDGYIYIYNNDRYIKADIKRVPVQVKGRGVCSKVQPTINYPVTVVDLNNYMRNGGVLFFVVNIDKETGEVIQIYYSSLLPYKIMSLLKNNKRNKKNIRITFNQFPTDPQDAIDIFLNFYSDAQRQVSFAGKKLPTIDELQNKGQLDGLTFSYASVKDKSSIVSLPKLLAGKEMYIYANIKNGIAPVPVEYYETMTHIHIWYTDNITVSVNGKVYYENIEKIINKSNIIYRIGSILTIALPNVDCLPEKDQCIKINISIKLQGSLKQRIKGIEFLFDMLAARKMEWAGLDFPINFSDTELKKLNRDAYENLLLQYKRMEAVFEKLHITKDLPMDDLSIEDLRQLDCLVEAIENGTPIKSNTGNLPAVVCLNFAGLNLLMLCEKQGDENYKIWDFFDKHIDVCAFDESERPFPASQYSTMKANDFLTVDNLYLPAIIEDFKHVEPQAFIAENGNIVMLEMLKAYDQNNSSELFDSIKQMYDWLVTLQEYLDDNIMLINHLQIIRRERALNFAEKQRLYGIVRSDVDPVCRLGALILLNEQDEAEKILNVMSEEEKNEFMSYPIMRFYDK